MKTLSKVLLVDLVGQGILIGLIALTSVGGFWFGEPYFAVFSIACGGPLIGLWQVLSGLLLFLWRRDTFRQYYLLAVALYLLSLTAFSHLPLAPDGENWALFAIAVAIPAALCLAYFIHTVRQYVQTAQAPKSFWDIV